VTREEWQRIKAVTADALEQPESARRAYVVAACGDDAALREQVDKYLQSCDASAALFETPAVSTPGAADVLVQIASQSLVGTFVDSYRIVRELGQGGMGRVYLAERTDGEFDRHVAIKFVAGLPTSALLQRFREERRIHAALDHPNIARLIDSGATADGYPYVMMEYIDGVPIDEFADARALSVNARIGLFLQVCGAVQYAHQRLVIHRDLKARNILVTADGKPKLLDFGIAKLLDPDMEAAEPTRTLYRLITLETASPEQIRGEPVTTAADIYSLGMLLYRVLAGQSPYQLKSRDETAVIRAICEQEPVAPSRRTPVRAFIDRDLDLIVLKALRKEPERRYATVQQLSDDLQRFLDGRPIQAAPDARTYRIKKFVGRHRLGVVAAAALGIAVAGGTLATAWQAQIANRERARAQGRFDDVRQLVNTFLFDVHDAIQNLPGAMPARRLLITRVLDYLEKIGRDAGAESLLQLEIATAYQKVGNVQGNPYSANIGDAAGAMQSFQKALAISKTLVDRDPRPSHREALGASHHLVGDMLWGAGSFPDALEQYRRAVALRERLAADDPSEGNRLELALSHYSVGQTLLRMGNYAGAAEAYTRAQALQTNVLEQHPANAAARRAFATSAAKLGDVLAVQGDHRAALDYHAKATVILEEASAADPVSTSNRRTLSLMKYRVSVDRNETGDFQGAVEAARQALDLQTQILSADPTNVQARGDVAVIRRTLGEALFELNQRHEALVELGAAEQLLRAALASNPNGADNAGTLAMTLLLRGDVLAKEGAVWRARDAYAEAATLLDGQAAREEASRYRGMVHEHAGDLERQLARAAAPAARAEHMRAACRHYQQGLDALERRSRTGDSRDAAQLKGLADKLADCASRRAS
jgi:non-specific serine/threonine protein kinase/serine/threonine-protein kinase